MSTARARYLTARTALEKAKNEEETERKSSSGMSQRLRMATHYVECLARDCELARSEYYREFREALEERDPAFKRMQAQATVACQVYYGAKSLRDDLRKLIMAARRVPEFQGLETLEAPVQYAAERLRMATDSGARAQLEACNAELETLRRAHEDYSAQAFNYLEHAIDAAESEAA